MKTRDTKLDQNNCKYKARRLKKLNNSQYIFDFQLSAKNLDLNLSLSTSNSPRKDGSH